MFSDTAVALENLDMVYRSRHQDILNYIDEYIYREERYKVHFSVVLIYSELSLDLHTEALKKTIRKSDRLLSVANNIIFVVFDAMEAENCVKTGENLYKTLKAIEYHQDYFISTVFSKEFSENYLNMINHLFERLHHSVDHKCYNRINDEDFII